LDAVTAAALSTLWARGYEATSIDDLTAATGLNPSSLYAAFGSKRGVLEAAIARYTANMENAIVPLVRGSRGLADVRAFLDRICRHIATPPNMRGCFMINTMTEISARDPDIAERSAAYRARIREGLAAALARAVDRGELQARTADDRAHVLQAGLFGALVAARAGAVDEAIAAVDALRRETHRWRNDQLRSTRSTSSSTASARRTRRTPR
jgi:TetR/AcrR family transcriptional repressor of nem operon